MSVPSYPFHSLPLKLPNKGMDFPFPPLRLLNKGREGKGREKYFKIILFIHFHSIPFSPPKRGLKVRGREKIEERERVNKIIIFSFTTKAIVGCIYAILLFIVAKIF